MSCREYRWLMNKIRRVIGACRKYFRGGIFQRVRDGSPDGAESAKSIFKTPPIFRILSWLAFSHTRQNFRRVIIK